MRKNHNKRWKIFRITVSILAVHLMFAICWVTTFYLTSFIYHNVDQQPPGFVKQMINALGSFFILGMILFLIGEFMHPKRRAVFHELTDAIRRIAKGDFNVNLEVNERHLNPFTEVFDSINHMAVELNQMEQVRQEFISNVSHEIQSPLTSISGFTKALRNDQLSREERLHYLGIIEMESTRLSKLSENLLKLASLEAERYPVERKRYRLDKQLRSIVLSCEPQWVEKNIDIDISLEEVMIMADEDRLSQVWVNLINNSIKFSARGGTVGIQLKQNNDEVIVCVSDAGIGIAAEDQAHIFERFYKADKSRNRMSGGSGLGLSIVKKIIEMHDGSIQVESKLGEGTKFTVHLPQGVR